MIFSDSETEYLEKAKMYEIKRKKMITSLKRKLYSRKYTEQQTNLMKEYIALDQKITNMKYMLDILQNRISKLDNHQEIQTQDNIDMKADETRLGDIHKSLIDMNIIK